ncbi:MAG TPA: hypothetical protein VLA96_02305 [Terriglobales bacterium]|nr:hypothetical protein [Terriglobales bacterium]
MLPRAAFGRPRQHGLSLLRVAGLLPLFFFLLLVPSARAGNIKINVSQAPGGAAITGARPNYTMNMGNVNGIGAGGATVAGVSVLSTSFNGGALYASPYRVTFQGLPAPHRVQMTAYVSGNFTKSAALIVYSCPEAGACTVASNFNPMSLNAGAQTVVLPTRNRANNTPFDADIGVLVMNLSGASAFSTGIDTATVTLFAQDLDVCPGGVCDSDTATITLRVSASTALRLVLETGTLSPACTMTNSGSTSATTYSLSVGNINGLGIDPAGNCANVIGTNPVIWYTNYRVTPSFTNYSTTTGSLAIAVKTNFAKSALLSMREADVAANLNAGTLPRAAFSITNGVTLNRVVGVAMNTAALNGPTSFGSDSATITYTLTVP